MKRGWWIAAALCAALITGCGGGGSGGGTASAGSPGTQSNAAQNGTATFLVKIPPAPATQASSRSPQYISAATQSIAIAITAGEDDDHDGESDAVVAELLGVGRLHDVQRFRIGAGR